MFHDVTWARHSKQAFSALENNVAPIRSRRYFAQHSASCPHRCCAITVASLPPKTILSVFLPYSFVLPYIRKTKGRRRGKESDNERCSIEPTQVLGTWGTFIGIFAKGGEWWRRMRFGSRRSFVILLPKQNYPKSVISFLAD